MAETPFAHWLDRERERRDLNYSGLASLVGVRANTARAWCLGEAEPSPGSLRDLAAVFHVNPIRLYRLLGWLPEEKTSIAPAKEELIDKLMDVWDENLDMVEASIDAILRRQEQRQPPNRSSEESSTASG